MDLQVDLSQDVERLLSSGEIDLALLNGPIRKTSFTSVPLGTYRYGWFTSPDVAAGLGQTPDFPDMYAAGLMAHSKNTFASKQLRDHVKGLGLPIEGVTHVNSLATLMGMAAHGMGIALLPRQLIKSSLTQDRLTEVKCGWVADPLEFFACRNKNVQSLYVEEAALMAAQVASESRG